MPLHERSEGKLRSLATTGREPIEQLPVRQACHRTDVKESAEVP
jgi:hypothetical protein